MYDPLGPGLPSHVAMLFNCPIRGIMPIINRPWVGRDNDEEPLKYTNKKAIKDAKNQGTPTNYVSIPIGLL